MYNKTVKLSNGITVPQLALGTWLIDAYKAGKIRAIGVSNFLKVDIDNLLEKAEVRPMVNQVLCHISNTPIELIKYCQERGIVMEAYRPTSSA